MVVGSGLHGNEGSEHGISLHWLGKHLDADLQETRVE